MVVGWVFLFFLCCKPFFGCLLPRFNEWLWLKIQQLGQTAGFKSLFPFTKGLHWVHVFEPQPLCFWGKGSDSEKKATQPTKEGSTCFERKGWLLVGCVCVCFFFVASLVLVACFLVSASGCGSKF